MSEQDWTEVTVTSWDAKAGRGEVKTRGANIPYTLVRGDLPSGCSESNMNGRKAQVQLSSGVISNFKFGWGESSVS
jgi:hypothetical protein